MAVNLTRPDPARLHPVAGLRLGVAMAGVRKKDRRDLLVLRLPASATVAALFTRNQFCAAPVVVARRHLKTARAIAALVVNTGNANAGTGADGERRSTAVCAATARLIGCRTDEVLPFSTGVIMEPLPSERIVEALPSALAAEADWLSAAEAIMTTDTVPKAYSMKVRLTTGVATITGIAKGSGMIRPDMATMLAFVATDASVARPALRRLLQAAADGSFNCVTVDGDMSTNDAFVLVATGQGPRAATRADLATLGRAVSEVSRQLAQAMVRDGEGATKFVTVSVEGGRSREECRRVGYAIAHSPLVKTAFFASDPNLGRILAAIGYSGVANLDPARIDLFIDRHCVVRRGARSPGYREEQGARAMAKPEFEVRAVLHRGKARATLWTCDLSHEYVKINAEYRS